MHCFTEKIVGGQILVPVFITTPVGEDSALSADNFVQALVDTGATRTCISPRAVKTLGVSPIDKKDVHTAAGKVQKFVYQINAHVMLPHEQEEGEKHFHMKNYILIDVMEADCPPRFDMLLGMDVIRQGSLHVSGEHFTFCA